MSSQYIELDGACDENLVISILGRDLWALSIVATISTHLGEEHELVCCAKIIVKWVEIDFYRID